MKTLPKGLVVTAPAPGDKAAWRVLYNGYAEFYKVPMTDQTADTVWGWIHDPKHEVNALVAKAGDGVWLAWPITARWRAPWPALSPASWTTCS